MHNQHRWRRDHRVRYAEALGNILCEPPGSLPRAERFLQAMTLAKFFDQGLARETATPAQLEAAERAVAANHPTTAQRLRNAQG